LGFRFDAPYSSENFSVREKNTALLMDKPFEVAVSFTDQVPENIPGEFISSLEDVGVDVETEKRQSGPYAGYEWLLPTAVIVYISDKYFGTMLQKMAEDHYSAIKNGLKRLISRTAGPDREIQLNYVASSPAKVSSNEAPPLSIYSKLSDGRPIKFVVEYLPDEEDVSKCINSMIEVMENTTMKLTIWRKSWVNVAIKRSS